MSYAYSEAFCHMKYRCEDRHEESLWNSRDGVTPFAIPCRECGKLAQHVEWQNDRRDPAYVPKKGERIFVSITEDRMAEYTRRQIEKFWDHPEYSMSDRWDSKQRAFDELMKERRDRIGEEPDIVEWE